MDYEKKYKEALERAKQFSETPYLEDSKGIVEYIFPELAESEDERIRIWIREELESKYVVDNIVNNVMADKALAWLEKQGERKSVKVPKFKVGDFIQFNGMGHTRYTIKEVCGLSHYINTCNKRMDMSYTDANFKLVEQKPWSEEDDKMLEDIVSSINHESVIEGLKCRGINYSLDTSARLMGNLINWLKSIKDRVQPQPKQEWSKEDKVMLDEIVDFFENGTVKLQHDLSLYASWLKSLRPQNWTKEDKERYISCLQRLGTGNPEQPETINSKWFKEHVYPQNRWRPSGEQMKMLDKIIDTLSQMQLFGGRNALMELKHDLNKLTE